MMKMDNILIKDKLEVMLQILGHYWLAWVILRSQHQPNGLVTSYRYIFGSTLAQVMACFLGLLLLTRINFNHSMDK